MEPPARVVAHKRLQSAVADAEQSDVFQVRLHHAPAAPQVFVKAVFGQFGEDPPDVLRRPASPDRVRGCWRCLRIVKAAMVRPPPRATRSNVSSVVAQQGRVQGRERSSETWTKSLKCPACSEASWRLSVKESSLSGPRRCGCGMAQQRGGEHGGCAGAGFAGERGQLGELAFTRRVELAAVQAERERRRAATTFSSRRRVA